MYTVYSIILAHTPQYCPPSVETDKYIMLEYMEIIGRLSV